MELITYLGILVGIVLGFIGSMKILKYGDIGSICEVFGILGSIIFGSGAFVFFITGFVGMGKTITQTSPATPVRVGNEIVVTSKFPTQIVTDIKYIDKEVYVERNSRRSVWGYEMGKVYQVKIKK